MFFSEYYKKWVNLLLVVNERWSSLVHLKIAFNNTCIAAYYYYYYYYYNYLYHTTTTTTTTTITTALLFLNFWRSLQVRLVLVQIWVVFSAARSVGCLRTEVVHSDWDWLWRWHCHHTILVFWFSGDHSRLGRVPFGTCWCKCFQADCPFCRQTDSVKAL